MTSQLRANVGAEIVLADKSKSIADVAVTLHTIWKSISMDHM